MPGFYESRIKKPKIYPSLGCSALQIAVISGTLNEQLVTLTNSFDCETGDFADLDTVLENQEPYGVLTVEDIVAKSSNIGSAKIGVMLGSLRFQQYLRNFGFGARTGVLLPGEESGNVPSLKDWNELSIPRISMGREITVTPMQMVMAMCAIANNGYLMRPMLVQQLADRRGNVVTE